MGREKEAMARARHLSRCQLCARAGARLTLEPGRSGCDSMGADGSVCFLTLILLSLNYGLSQSP